jgi:hypothetical protein
MYDSTRTRGQETTMKIQIVKKGEAKIRAPHVCPWFIEVPGEDVK